MSTSGWLAMRVPTAAPSPLTRLNTPGGTPASSRISAKISAEIGDTSLGLSTIVQPAASAAATLQPTWFIGQFHGVISAHTPTGSRTTRVLLTTSSNACSRSTDSASRRCASPAAACAWRASADRRAHLARDRLGQLALAALVDRDHAFEQRDALLARRHAEARERAARGGDGVVHVLRRAHRDRRERLLGGRVDHVDAGRAVRRAPRAVDVELERTVGHAGVS